MRAVEILVALRRRWRLILIFVALATAISWFTVPAAKGGVTGPRTYTAGLHVRSLTKTNLDDVALDAAEGVVPNAVRAKFLLPPSYATGVDPADNRGAPRKVRIGTPKTYIVDLTVKPDYSRNLVRITGNGTNPIAVKTIVEALGAALIDFENTRDAIGIGTQITTAEADIKKTQADLTNYKNANAACADAACRRTTLIQVRETDNQLKTKQTALGRLKSQQQKKAPRFYPQESNVQAAPVLTTSGVTIPRRRPIRVALGMMIGFLVGALAAYGASRFDTSIYGVASTEEITRLPVLCEIPYVSSSRRRRFDVLTHMMPTSRIADAYRGLRTSVQLMWMANASAGDDATPRTLLVTSAGPSEGKSTTCANLAAAYGEMGKSVIVLDLDYRRRRLYKFLDAAPEPHLENTGTTSEPHVDIERLAQTTGIPGVRFINSADSTSTPADAMLAGQAAIQAAREVADIVIIDTPPLLVTNDAFDLLPYADAVILMARDATTKTNALSRATQQLRRLDAPVLGVALIGAVSSRPGYGYGYGYSYGYSYSRYGYGYSYHQEKPGRFRGRRKQHQDEKPPVVTAD